MNRDSSIVGESSAAAVAAGLANAAWFPTVPYAALPTLHEEVRDHLPTQLLNVRSAVVVIADGLCTHQQAPLAK